MATYPPPTYTEPLSIFNTIYFESGDTTITIDYANKHYLKYPVAQGTETLQETIHQGVATFNDTMIVNDEATFNDNVDMNKPLTMTGSVSTDRIINNVFYQLQDSSDLTNTTAQIYANANIVYYDNNENSGTHQFATNNGAGVQSIPLSISSSQTIISADNGATSTATLLVRDSATSKGININPNATNNAYNPIVNTNDSVIASTSGGNLVLTANSATTNGVRCDPTQTFIGFGGTTDTPTTSVVCNGTSVVVNPSLTFPDSRVQNSAFTGAGALQGSYTLTNMTIDSNGKITAISNGSTSSQFQPTFHNLANYQTGTSGYSQGAYINWSSGWGALDYVIIRYRVQMNWGGAPTGWTNYATSAGELIIRPYYATAGVMGSLSSPNQFWTTNSGSLFGATGKLLYSTGVINNGSQGYFFIYGNGGSGGGASGYIQLMADATGASGGWEFTQTYEYMVRSTSGGTITFTNGAGGGTATTNNSLP